MNSIHQLDGKWWFWDETWSQENGPYDSEVEVKKALEEYCVQLNERHNITLPENQEAQKQNADQFLHTQCPGLMAMQKVRKFEQKK